MTTATKKGFELLNEKGIQLVEVKKVLYDNQSNTLIYNGLKASLKKSDYSNEVYEALTDNNMNETKFASLLVTFDKYINATVLQEQFKGLQAKLSTALEKKLKYFTTESSPKDGGVLVIRKFGISMEYIMRVFRLREDEARALLSTPFAETFAKLKLTAFFKDIVEKIQKETKTKLEVRHNEMYFNEVKNFFNMDLIVVVPVIENIQKTTVGIGTLRDEIAKIISYAEGQYYKIVKGE